MDKKLLELLVCPKCNGKLEYDKKNDELVCRTDNLAYALSDGIPVMLEEEARALKDPAKDSTKSSAKGSTKSSTKDSTKAE